MTKHEKFKRNFKILFNKGDKSLFDNKNLFFWIFPENCYHISQEEFISEIAGNKPITVNTQTDIFEKFL